MFIIVLMQLATFHQVGIPANWKEGEDVLIGNDVPRNMVAELFPKVRQLPSCT